MEQGYTLLRKVNRASTNIAVAMILLMVVHIAISAVMRYGFKQPLSGSMVIVSYYYMIFIVFLPLADVEDSDDQIVVDVLYLQFGSHLRAVADVITSVFSILVTGGLAWRTWLEFLSKYQADAGVFENGVRIILWPTYLALPIGFGLLCLTLIAKSVLRLSSPAKTV